LHAGLLCSIKQAISFFSPTSLSNAPCVPLPKHHQAGDRTLPSLLSSLFASKILTATHDNLRHHNRTTTATPLEQHRRRQTSNLLIILGKHIRKHSVLSRRHLLGQLHRLAERHLALFERAAEIDLVDLFAQVDFLVEDADEAVFDLEVDFGAGFDGAGEVAFGGDDEVGAAGGVLEL